MQLLEAGLGLRSAVIELRRRGTPLRFVLFPMVHVGDPAFYEAVAERLRGCDLVVAEGIQGRSRKMSALSRSYGLAKRGRSGLVRQDIDYSALGVPAVCPDMTAEGFRAGWREIPLRERAVIWAVVPAGLLYVGVFGGRASLARYLAFEDDHGVDLSLGSEAVDRLILEERDRLLLDALAAIHESRAAEPITVGVVYGAGHMVAVVHQMLARFGYVARSAEWLTVFDY